MLVPFPGGVVSSVLTVSELDGDLGALQAWLAAHNCLVYAIEYGERHYRIYHAALRH
jgi:hypothetical protein